MQLFKVFDKKKCVDIKNYTFKHASHLNGNLYKSSFHRHGSLIALDKVCEKSAQLKLQKISLLIAKSAQMQGAHVHVHVL